MDEITLLTAVRPDPPADSDRMLAAARARLAAGTGRISAHPARAVRRLLPPRRAGAVAATAVALAAAVVLTQTVTVHNGSISTGGPPADAATVLLAKAAVAAAADETRTRRGDYVWRLTLYTMTSSRGRPQPPFCQETWSRVRGVGVVVMVPRRVVNGRCAGAIPVAVPRNVTAGASAGRLPYPAHPSSDPRTLLQQVYRQVPAIPLPRGAGERDLVAWYTLTSMIKDNLGAPPRSTLFRTLALVPGTRVVTDAVDAAGRHGVGITLGWSTIVLDRGDYRYLGARHDQPSEPSSSIASAELRSEVFPR